MSSKQGPMSGLIKNCKLCGDEYDDSSAHFHMLGHFIDSSVPSSVSYNTKHGLIHDLNTGVLFPVLAPPTTPLNRNETLRSVGIVFDGSHNDLSLSWSSDSSGFSVFAGWYASAPITSSGSTDPLTYFHPYRGGNEMYVPTGNENNENLDDIEDPDVVLPLFIPPHLAHLW